MPRRGLTLMLDLVDGSLCGVITAELGKRRISEGGAA
jgi:hypothetical protein